MYNIRICRIYNVWAWIEVLKRDKESTNSSEFITLKQFWQIVCQSESCYIIMFLTSKFIMIWIKMGGVHVLSSLVDPWNLVSTDFCFENRDRGEQHFACRKAFPFFFFFGLGFLYKRGVYERIFSPLCSIALSGINIFRLILTHVFKYISSNVSVCWSIYLLYWLFEEIM